MEIKRYKANKTTKMDIRIEWLEKRAFQSACALKKVKSSGLIRKWINEYLHTILCEVFIKQTNPSPPHYRGLEGVFLFYLFAKREQ